MSDIVKSVFTFLEGIIKVLGEDAKKVAAYCEENKVLSFIVEILEALGLCLLDAIKILVMPSNPQKTFSPILRTVT